jgi:hypothetical protein|nr:MAG TPA: hypothetical protein [Caudoviricetes sp.]
MLDLIKMRCGIAAAVTVYDEDIKSYIEDCKQDMILAGVAKELIEEPAPGVVTAITFYVKAHIGNDRADTEKYMDLFEKKIFRLSMMEREVAPVQPEEEDDDVE